MVFFNMVQQMKHNIVTFNSFYVYATFCHVILKLPRGSGSSFLIFVKEVA